MHLVPLAIAITANAALAYSAWLVIAVRVTHPKTKG